MDRLDAISAFVVVADAGGFSAASRRTGQPQGGLSRKVAQLEDALGCRLLARSTRHVALTDEGVRYLEVCRRLLDDLQDVERELAGDEQRPKGELVISAPLSFGHRHLLPVVQDFMQAQPQVTVQLHLGDRLVSLLQEHVDCALRISNLADSGLVARKLGSIRLMVAAAPSYLAQHEAPQCLEDLLAHDCIEWASSGPVKTWPLAASPGQRERAVPIRTRLSTNTADAAVEAAVAGLGLVQATSYQLAPAIARGALVPLLQEFELPPMPVSLVYQTRRLAPMRLRSFLDFAAPRLEEALRTIDGQVSNRQLPA